MTDAMVDTTHRPTAQAALASARSGTGPLLVASAVCALAGNLLHPRYSGPDVLNYREIAGSSRYVAADLVLLPALVLLTLGLAALARALSGPLADAARVAAVLGGVLAIAQTGVELQGVRQQARIFSGAAPQDRVGAFWSTNALDRLNGALTATWIVVLLGLVPLLFSVLQLRTRTAPRWAALAGLAGGGLCACVGLIDLVSQDQGQTDVAFLIGSLLATGWVLATGLVGIPARTVTRAG